MTGAGWKVKSSQRGWYELGVKLVWKWTGGMDKPWSATSGNGGGWRHRGRWQTSEQVSQGDKFEFCTKPNISPNPTLVIPLEPPISCSRLPSPSCKDPLLPRVGRGAREGGREGTRNCDAAGMMRRRGMMMEKMGKWRKRGREWTAS